MFDLVFSNTDELERKVHLPLSGWCNGNTAVSKTKDRGSIPLPGAKLIVQYITITSCKLWGVSSVGRALGLQSRCHEFKPHTLHQYIPTTVCRKTKLAFYL